MPPQSEHLSRQQVEAAARRESDDRTLDHLQVCEHCRSKVADWRDWDEKVHLLRHSEPLSELRDCPAVETLAAFASGTDVPGAGRILEHVADCERCGKILYVASGPAEEMPNMPSLRTSTPEWQTWMAARFAAGNWGDQALSSGRAWRGATANAGMRRNIWAVYGGLAAAATLLIAVWLWHSQRAPLELLAQAYSARRTLELRVPGARFAVMTIERGAEPSDRPLPLLKSEEAIAGHSSSDINPDWLHAKGRAALLEWRYDEAIPALQAAADSARPNSPDRAAILVDLASAYFERAQKDNRAIDDSKAVELLGQAIQTNPQMAMAYFNRAIVEKYLFLYETAVRDWEEYLKLDSTGGWADEARRRLADLKRDMAVAQPDNLQRLAGLDEDRLDRAMQQGFSGTDADSLAETWQAKHRDSFLRDAAAASAAPEVATLRSLTETRLAMKVDGFRQEIGQIATLRPTAPSLQAWAKFELLFRVLRSDRPLECVTTVGPAVELARHGGYAWLLAQSLLEQASCDAAAGHAENADKRIEEAEQIAATHAFPVIELRAEGFQSSRLSQMGEYREANAVQQRMLEVFWSKPLPFGRAQQFYTDLMWTAEGLGRWHTAVEAAWMSAAMAERAGFRATEAVVRARWAGAAERLGMAAEARAQAGRSHSLFSQLAPSPVTDSYRAFAVAVSAQNIESRAALDAFQHDRDPSGSSLVNAAYWRAVARFDLQESRPDLAEVHLSHAVTLFAAGADMRRIGGNAHWRFEYESALRELLLVKIERGDADEAYWMWQKYLESTPSSSAGGRPADMVTFLRLGGRYGRWFRHGVALQFAWIEGDADAIEARVRLYAELCGHPPAFGQDVRPIGAALRAVLLGSSLQPYLEDRVLVIQPDGPLAALPWQALGGPDQLVAISLLGAPLRRPVLISSDTPQHVLVVAVPKVSGPLAGDYLPLGNLGSEVDSIRDAYRDVRVLEGPAATATHISEALETADMLHFAGHARTRPEGASLLISDGEGGSESWTPAAKGLQLAVLSACSTARYAETEGAGPLNLAHEMLLSGVRQVVAAQWNADSTTTNNFMRVFYGELAKGVPAVQALARARNAIRSQPEYKHPYYWALFSLFVQNQV